MAGLQRIGTTLAFKAPRHCGICGELRVPTRAHVPPQSAGNTKDVLRAADVIDHNRIRRPGRWSDGGMWVRGQCTDCNNLASRYDPSYADFAAQVARLSTPGARSLQIKPWASPAATLSPEPVIRSVLFGMFGMHPRLRTLFSELAEDLASAKTALRWPDQLSLRIGRTHPSHADQGVLMSGIWMMQVLGQRAVHCSFADVVFPPLAWFLVPDDDLGDETTRPPQLGPQITEPLPRASSWIHAHPVTSTVDLRSLTPTLPFVRHPALGPDRASWIEFLADDRTDAQGVLVLGRIPQSVRDPT